MLIRMAAALLAGTLYWWAASAATGADEPWDADIYWIVLYPISLCLSAAGGAWFGRRGWIAGALFTLGQVPVLLLDGAIGALWAVGAAMLLLLAVPAMLAAHVASRLVHRRRP